MNGGQNGLLPPMSHTSYSDEARYSYTLHKEHPKMKKSRNTPLELY